eukprot:3745184-Rhodomonas_salina.2
MDKVPWLRTIQAWQHITIFALLPATAFFTRQYWAGKPVDETRLKENYPYADDMVKNQKKALQDLLDAAKAGKPGGHQAGQEWNAPVPEHQR